MSTDAAAPDVPAAPVDQADLPLKDLARAILARQFRPRVSSIRRLAEAVLEPKKKGKKKGAKKKTDKAVRKLARIPGQNDH